LSSHQQIGQLALDAADRARVASVCVHSPDPTGATANDGGVDGEQDAHSSFGGRAVVSAGRMTDKIPKNLAIPPQFKTEFRKT
jgi:hypothetical protein